MFLRTGDRLKISQTPYALFVSFDRSVVEEYRFREHRLVNVGPIEADRASGWMDGKYVIQTLDNDGALLEESYEPEAGGDVLVRSISVIYGDEEILSFEQVYDRRLKRAAVPLVLQLVIPWPGSAGQRRVSCSSARILSLPLRCCSMSTGR